MKNQCRIKILPDPVSIIEPASKNYVDNIFRIDIDFNDVKLENIKFVKVNYQHAVNEHLTLKMYVDIKIDESSLVRNDQDNDLNNCNLTNIDSNNLNKQAENVNEVLTKAYVDHFHPENERSRRKLGNDFDDESSDLVKIIQNNDLSDNKLTIRDSIS